ncbi:MAG: GNAT family protein [Vicinamibacterales bacterium]
MAPPEPTTQATGVPFLEGRRITLRPLVASDADGAYPQWLNDPEICAGNSHHVQPYSRDQARTYIAQSQDLLRDLVLAIVVTQDDAHIGNISLSGIHPIYRKAEFSILVGARSHWGQGYGEEAGRLLLHHGFTALNLNRIECGTFAHNVAMQRLAAALGMRREGVRRQAAFKDGGYVDVFEYGVLRAEFFDREAEQ